MDLAVPRFGGEVRAGQQHMVTLERSRGGGRRPGRHDQPQPVLPVAAALRTAASNASLPGLLTRSAPPGQVPVEAGQARLESITFRTARRPVPTVSVGQSRGRNWSPVKLPAGVGSLTAGVSAG